LSNREVIVRRNRPGFVKRPVTGLLEQHQPPSLQRIQRVENLFGYFSGKRHTRKFLKKSEIMS